MIAEASSPGIVALPSLHSAVHFKGSGNVPQHSHEQAELLLVLHGDISVQVEQCNLEGKEGNLFIIPAQKPHRQQCGGKWQTLGVLFFNRGQIIDEAPRVINFPKDFQIRPWLLELASLYGSAHPVPKIVYDGLLLALLCQISHIENNLKVTEALPPRLAAAVRYLQEHANEEVDVEALARASGTSYSRLGFLFRDYFDCAPLKFHQLLRLEMAKRHLLNPYTSVEEVANQLGFTDSNYFCRIFRKTLGVPPGIWRKTATSLTGSSRPQLIQVSV